MRLTGHLYRIDAPRKSAVRIRYLCLPCVDFAIITMVYSVERVFVSEIPGLLLYQDETVKGYAHTVLTGPAQMP